MSKSSCDRARRRKLAIVWLAIGMLAGCATLSISEEQRLGNQVAGQMQQELVFLHDPVVQDYLRDIGEKVVAAAGPQPFEYRFYVVVNEEINAFAAPAGFIYVHTGTILEARNVAELAGVIAHEVGHVAERHVAKNYNRQKNTQIGYQAAVLAASALAGGLGATAAQMGGGVAAMAYLNQFGREAEMEADAFAIGVLPRAGYDPRGLVTFFQTLQSENGGGGGFLSSHPATSERINTTSAALDGFRKRPDLQTEDGGKLEIIQRRIRLLTQRPGNP